MDHLTKKQLNQLRKQLLRDKTDLQKRMEETDHYGLENSLSDSIGEFSTYDNHPADIGTEEFERGKDIALNENAEHHLEEVLIALENMEIGHYGACLACGKPIPFERLEAIPSAQYCFKHVPDRQVSERRPIEEQFLAPPFGRTSLDELDEQNQFDGEDAWQIVEEWGTSDSPAMAEDPNDANNYNHMVIEAGESDGFVQPIDTFLATDIFGENVTVIRNHEYRKYLDNNEGDSSLEVKPEADNSDKGW